MKTACMNILEIVLHEFLDGRFMQMVLQKI